MWSVWDRKSNINGATPERVFATFKHLAKEEIIFLETLDGKVTYVAGKNTLATLYGLDPALTNDEFIAAYEAKLAELEEQARLEAPDKPIEEPDPETDTTTYAELAQVYAEGVNSIE